MQRTLGLILGWACAALAGLVPLSAAAVELKPATEMEGFVSQATGLTYTNWYMLAGNNNASLFGYCGIMKFSLADITSEVSQAILSLWRIRAIDTRGEGGVYVQLQHYNFDNTAALDVSDAAADNVENVGLPVLMPVYPDEPLWTRKQWDVTAYVEADRSAGFNCSSFRIIATDAAGNAINTAGHGAYFCTQDTWDSAAFPPNTALYPRIEATVSESSAPEDDLTLFASQWLRQDCQWPDWCLGADINQDAMVNLTDFSYKFGPVHPITLVENGVCRVSITHVFNPSPVEQWAAQQLQAAFLLAAGVEPPLNPSVPNQIQIFLGVANRFSQGVGSDASQAYAVRLNRDGNVELLANSPEGVLWAVNYFCREVLHVTWPAADNQMALQGLPQTTLTVGRLYKIDAPDFERRGWHMTSSVDGPQYDRSIANWMVHQNQNVKTTHIFMLDSIRTELQNRGIEPDTNAHSFFWLVPADEYFDEHPEYFPLLDGIRTRPAGTGVGTQLCISNPNVRQIMILKAVQAFYTYPEVKVFGITPNDGSAGWCQCANCRAWDGDQIDTGVYSNRLIRLCNAIADALRPYYPDKYIGTNAYANYREPADLEVADNVWIGFAAGGRNLMKKLTDPADPVNAALLSQLTGWLNKTPNVWIYEYYYFSGLEYCYSPIARTLCQEYPELKALGVKGIYSETSSPQWPGSRLAYYAFARESWDTTLSYDQVLHEYCDERFGPASVPMQMFYRLYEDTLYNSVPSLSSVSGCALQYFPTAFSPQSLSTLQDYLTAAANAADGGTLYTIKAVADEQALFKLFRRTAEDPCDISGIGPNLFTNPGAESGSSFWGKNIQSGDYSLDVPYGNAHSGSRWLRTSCTGNPGWARWYQTVTVEPNRNYTCRFWIRASAGAAGMIWIAGSNNLFLNFQDTNDQWIRLVCPEMTATGNSLTFFLENRSGGTVGFDDAFLAVLPE